MRHFWKVVVSSLVVVGSLFAADIQELNSGNFDDVVKNSRYVIVDVYSQRCGACKQLEPVYERLNRDYGDKYLFAKMNGSQNFELSNSLKIKAYPTIIFYKKGKEVGREIGYMSDKDLLKKVRAKFK